MLQWPKKDPDEVLDYQIDWQTQGDSRLETGETLTASNFTVTEGDVVISSQSFSAPGLTTVWLSGGTAGTRCTITNHVTTSLNRQYEESARVRIRNK